MSELWIENRSERDLRRLICDSYDFYHILFTSFSSYNGYKLNSQLTYYRQGFIAQSVEHRTGIVEVMGSNPVEASELFLGFICNCLSYSITANISSTSRPLFKCR